MLCSTSGAHLEDQVLQTSCLRRRPMNTIQPLSSWDSSGVKDEVLDLTIEDVCIGVILVLRVIWIGIDDGLDLWCFEVRTGLDSGESVRVPDHLREVVWDDGRRDEVGAFWEVDDGW